MYRVLRLAPGPRTAPWSACSLVLSASQRPCRYTKAATSIGRAPCSPSRWHVHCGRTARTTAPKAWVDSGASGHPYGRSVARCGGPGYTIRPATTTASSSRWAVPTAPIAWPFITSRGGGLALAARCAGPPDREPGPASIRTAPPVAQHSQAGGGACDRSRICQRLRPVVAQADVEPIVSRVGRRLTARRAPGNVDARGQRRGGRFTGRRSPSRRAGLSSCQAHLAGAASGGGGGVIGDKRRPVQDTIKQTLESAIG